ncbi:unnamed protein product, partial [marine sediment metagenome]
GKRFFVGVGRINPPIVSAGHRQKDLEAKDEED